MNLLNGQAEEVSLDELASLAHSQDPVFDGLCIKQVADSARVEDQVERALLVVVLELEGEGSRAHTPVILVIYINTHEDIYIPDKKIYIYIADKENHAVILTTVAAA